MYFQDFPTGGHHWSSMGVNCFVCLVFLGRGSVRDFLSKLGSDLMCICLHLLRKFIGLYCMASGMKVQLQAAKLSHFQKVSWTEVDNWATGIELGLFKAKLSHFLEVLFRVTD